MKICEYFEKATDLQICCKTSKHNLFATLKSGSDVEALSILIISSKTLSVERSHSDVKRK